MLADLSVPISVRAFHGSSLHELILDLLTLKAIQIRGGTRRRKFGKIITSSDW
jgi:hypothetical protein